MKNFIEWYKNAWHFFENDDISLMSWLECLAIAVTCVAFVMFLILAIWVFAAYF